MVKSKLFHTVICDNCGADSNGDSEYSAWSEIDTAEDLAQESGWHCEDGKHYCNDCWSYDDDDNIQLRKIETK